MSETILIVVGAVGFLLAGTGLGFLLARLADNREAEKAGEVQAKFDAYRRDVTEHFGRTAEHFQSIGEQYRELYEHMASGADSFCDRDSMKEKLPFEPAAALAKETVSEASEETAAPRDHADEDKGDESGEAATELADASGDAKEAAAELASADEDAAETYTDPEKQIEEPTPEVTPDAEEESRRTLH